MRIHYRHKHVSASHTLTTQGKVDEIRKAHPYTTNQLERFREETLRFILVQTDDRAEFLARLMIRMLVKRPLGREDV